MARKTTSKTTTSKRKTSDKDATDKTETDAATATDDSTDTSEAASETSEGSAALSASLEGSDTTDSGEATESPTPEATTSEDSTDSPSDPDTTESESPDEPDTSTPGDDTPSDDPRPWGDTAPESANTSDTIETAEEPDAKPEPTPAPARTEQVIVRKGGFLPMLLGGVAAGAIGFGVAYYLFAQPGDTALLDALRTETDEKLQSQSDRLDALSEQMGTGAEVPDLSALEQGQADLQTSVSALSDQIAATSENLATLTTRVDELESRPLTEGASDTAVAAYEAELQKLQDAMAQQRAEIEKMTAQAQEMEQSAEATAQATMRRAALSRIQTALDAGGGYADALADLQDTGIEVPEILSSTADSGVATMTDLQESFPDAARAALAAARDAAAEAGETGGLSAFIRTQLGARSLEPREGDDPDAILSRAEAATNEGRLTDALAEIEALPEVARAELSDWAGRAARRLEAVAAAQELSEELN